MKKLFILVSLAALCLLGCLPHTSIAQAQTATAAPNLGQVVKGRITDADSKYPITGALVSVLGTAPILYAQTDDQGYYRISKVPLGRQTLRITLMGYTEAVIPNVLVTSGKEVVLDLSLTEKVSAKDAIEVVANKGNERLNATEVGNEMSYVSSRGFNIEETMRYAGSRNDPSRMASNFAGVQMGNDGRNDIIIRGNSPTGMLWRMDGVDIPNPSHFGSTGATGGPVSILNNNVLAKSDFFTGAFPAELGNAYSGAFDLNMRRGNKDKYEFLGQVGFNGFELGAEGPLAKNGKGSFLANYRYSAIGLVSNLGVNVGTGAAVPYYQDLTFKTSLDVGKNGRIELWGIGGISNIFFGGGAADSNILYNNPRQRLDYATRMGAVGATYTHFLTPNTYAKFILAATASQAKTKIDSLGGRDYDVQVPQFNEDMTLTKMTARYMLSHKFSTQATLTAGVMIDRLGYDMFSNVLQYRTLNGRRETFMRTLQNSEGATWLTQAYAQYQYRFSDHLVANAGLHVQNLSLNSRVPVEPRANLRYTLDERNSFTAGYGLHSQIQPLAAYFVEALNPDQTTTRLANQKLDVTQSHHYVVGYNRVLGTHTRLRMEAYYQDIFNVPVSNNGELFSMLNYGSDFNNANETDLVNQGRGRNYGLEMTVERTFSQGYYFLVTGSLYDSKYTAIDGVWRNTAFNGNWLLNVLGGYEWKVSEKFSLNFDTKLTTGGGRYYTPFDIAASTAAQQGILDRSQTNAARFDNYFRLDVKVGARLNGARITQEFFVDVQNVTNRENPFVKVWNVDRAREATVPQLGLFPNVNYRVTF